MKEEKALTEFKWKLLKTGYIRVLPTLLIVLGLSLFFMVKYQSEIGDVTTTLLQTILDSWYWITDLFS